MKSLINFNFKLLKFKLSSSIILSLCILTLFLIPINSTQIIVAEGAEPRLYADYIFLNSTILTVNQSNTIAEAIAIANGEIIAVGDNEMILDNYETEGNTTFDLEGKTIMPGIIDGHTHLMASAVWYGHASYKECQDLALSHGYTTLNEKSVDESEWTSLQQAEANGTLKTRVNLFMIHNYAFLDGNLETIIVERYWPSNNPILTPDAKIRVPGVKIYTDGASGGAKGLPAMTVPYTSQMLTDWNGHDPYGELFLNQTFLNATVQAIHDKGFICAFHTMGDRAMDTVLNALEYVLDGETNDNYRHQIEHSSFLRPDQITKIKTLDTVHSIRGYFPTYWQADYEAIYPTDWLDWTINRYSMPGEGIHSYLESDLIIFSSNDFDNWYKSNNLKPFLHMWGLVTKNALNSTGHLHTPDPWVSQYLLTREQALRLMTIEGAYAVKQEDYLGSLEVGKYADLIIISDNPLTCPAIDIKDIEVKLTMIDGTIEYQSPTYTLPIYIRTDSSNLFGADFTLPIIYSFVLIITVVTIKRKKKN